MTTQFEALSGAVQLLGIELQRLAASFSRDKVPGKAGVELELPGVDHDLIASALEATIRKGGAKELTLGLGTMVEPLKGKVTPKLLSDFGCYLAYSTDDPDPTLGPVLLHNIVLIARELRDPSSDLIAARLIAPQLVQLGRGQDALDAIDSFTLILPTNQGQHRSWRLSISWSIYADVCLRLHNPLAALRLLSFALVSLQEPPLHAGSFAELLRLCARTLRELNMQPFVGEFIAAERDFLGHFPHLADRLRQLDQLEFSLRVAEWNKADGPEPLHELARSVLERLKDNPPGKEIAPLYSVLVNAVRLLRLNGLLVPLDVEQGLQTWFGQLPERNRITFRSIVEGVVTVDDLRTLAMTTLRSSADWSQALTPATIAARNALGLAVAKGDTELFWAACLILCQPGLGVRVVEYDASNAWSDPAAGTQWFAKQIASGAVQPLDAVMVQRRMGTGVNPSSTPNPFDLKSSDFCSLLSPGESVILLATDDANAVYRCVITQDGAAAPTRLGVDQWDPERYRVWLRHYPAKHGYDLKIGFDTLLAPPPSEVTSAYVGLHPLAGIRAEHATVIAEARISGFAHALTTDLDRNINHLAVCPSPVWLAHVRHNVASTQGAAAWIGSPKTNNGILKDLRAAVTPILSVKQIQLSDAEQLPTLARRELVVLASHGAATQGEGFARISDDEHTYEPDTIATAVRESRCVILFVCHAGRGDERLYSHETTGLVSSLLRREVRTVVASLWPLSVDPAIAWLAAFGGTDRRLPIIERVNQAQREVARQAVFAAQHGEHPLIRNTFTVFGDGMQIIDC